MLGKEHWGQKVQEQTLRRNMMTSTEKAKKVRKDNKLSCPVYLDDKLKAIRGIVDSA